MTVMVILSEKILMGVAVHVMTVANVTLLNPTLGLPKENVLFVIHLQNSP